MVPKIGQAKSVTSAYAAATQSTPLLTRRTCPAEVLGPHCVSLPTHTPYAPQVIDMCAYYVRPRSWFGLVPAITLAQVHAYAQQLVRDDARFASPLGPALQALREAPDMSAPPLSPAVAKMLRKRLLPDLVDLMHRPDVTLRLPLAANKPPAVYVQRHGHVTESPLGASIYALAPAQTLSSETAKRQHDAGHERALHFGANEAAVTADTGELIAWRSGRSDTPDKLRNKLVGACIASLTAALPGKVATGCSIDANGQQVFRAALVSALDHSALKTCVVRVRNALATIFAFIGKDEDEAHYFANIQASLTRVFANGPFLVNVQVGDQVKAVRIEQPELLSITMSGMTYFSQSIRAHRASNVASALPLFHALAAAFEARPYDASARDLGRAMRFAAAAGPQHLTHFFERIVKAAPKHTLLKNVALADRMALDYLFLNMPNYNAARCDTYGRRLEGRFDTAQETQMLYHLLRVTKRAVGLECKSGVDRTLQLLGFFVALFHFARARAKAFVPFSQSADDRDVSSFFTRAANAFGKPIVHMVRGALGRIKWDETLIPGILRLPAYAPQKWYQATEGNPLGKFTWLKRPYATGGAP